MELTIVGGCYCCCWLFMLLGCFFFRFGFFHLTVFPQRKRFLKSECVFSPSLHHVATSAGKTLHDHCIHSQV